MGEGKPRNHLDRQPTRGTLREVFLVFLKLGITSFGGPIAHLGYFRDELVVRRRWIDDADYADLVALCQFLPGPASSQVGFLLGVLRGNGILGGMAAWFAFTMPSAVLLFGFALGVTVFKGAVAAALFHSLKLVAVAVVAQALWGMAQSLTPDRQRAAIAMIAALIAGLFPFSFGQIAAIGLGALAGLRFCRTGEAKYAGRLDFPVSRRRGFLALGLFTLLFAVMPILAGTFTNQGLALFNAFYRSGALVFGGGHVVLPLLQAEVVGAGWVTNELFLSGYGLAQAVPGPLFTFAAYLGAVVEPGPNGLMGAAIALLAIFLPGILLVYGTLPFWDRLRSRALAQAGMRGANAGVVGILAAAFYHPVWTSAILSPLDFAIALVGFLLLTQWKFPPWIVVSGIATVSTLIAMI